MSEFDLNSKNAEEAILTIVRERTAEIQTHLHQTGRPVFLTLNVPLVQSAVKFASNSIELHGINLDEINNTKRYAHVAFWLNRLKPVSYISGSGVNVILNHLKTRFAVSDDILEVGKVLPEVSFILPNSRVAFLTFCTLYCYQKHHYTEAPQRVQEAATSKHSKEIIKSLEHHNYSARSMCFMLENLVSEIGI